MSLGQTNSATQVIIIIIIIIMTARTDYRTHDCLAIHNF